MPTLSSAGRRWAPSAVLAATLEVVPPRLGSTPPEALQPQSAAATSMKVSLAIDHRQHPFVRRAPQRQSNLEVGARVHAAKERHRASVGLDALGHDGKADTGSTHRTALRPPALVERLEDSLAILGMHAGAVVGHVDHELGALHLGGDLDGSFARSELDRVREQVLEHELQLALVREHLDRGDLEVELDLLVRDREPVLAQDAEHHGLQLELCEIERRGLGLPGAEREQIFDELLQLDAVVAEDARDLLLLVVELADGAVEQELGALADVRERRLQLMRHVA